ncbi:hypothetical protein pb186bvf_015196 [Paramecium bursaria]
MGQCLIREKEKKTIVIVPTTVNHDIIEFKDLQKYIDSINYPETDISQVLPTKDKKILIISKLSTNQQPYKIIVIDCQQSAYYLTLHQTLQNGENIFLGSIYKKKQLYLIVKKASGLLAQVSNSAISSIDEIEKVILQRNKEKFEFCGTIFIKKTIILVFKSYYTKFREIEVTKQSEIIQDESKKIVLNDRGVRLKKDLFCQTFFRFNRMVLIVRGQDLFHQKKKHYKYILLWDCCKIIQNSKKIILEQKLKNMSRIPLSDITSTNKILKTKWTQSASKLTRTSIRSEIEKPIISEVRVQDRQTQTQMPLINLYHMPTPLRRSYMLALITMIVLILYFLTNIFELFRDEEILYGHVLIADN